MSGLKVYKVYKVYKVNHLAAKHSHLQSSWVFFKGHLSFFLHSEFFKDFMIRSTLSQSVPNGYPNPTRYPVFSSIPDPTRFNFENLRVAGNPKYRVLPEVSGNTRSFGYYPKFRVLPDVSGCKLFVNYPEYPELPGNTRNTRNYPRVKKIPENTRLYFSTLLPDPNPTRYPVFFPIPDPTRC